jgi:diguanylate cyclase (GGDEF)-like protein
MEEVMYGESGQKKWISLRVTAFIDPYDRRRRNIFVFIDITSVKLFEFLQNIALEGMARDLPVPEIFALVRREMENFLPGIDVAAFKVDEFGNVQGILPSHAVSSIEAAHRAMSPSEMDTPICEALKRRSTVTVRDIKESSYPRWIKDLYADMGIESVIAAPVHSSKKELIGLVAFFYKRKNAEESDPHARMADVMARICSIAMEWGEIRAALRMFTHYNPVTGLPNLNMLSTLVEQEMFAGQRPRNKPPHVAALCVNIERFRRINKNWGLKASNDALKIIAQRFLEAKSPSDQLAHSFEDEFVMFCLDCDAARAWETGKRMQAVLAAPILINGTEVILSANIGVSLRTEADASHELPLRLIEEARSALFRMKHGEHAQIRFFSALPQELSDNDISLEARLMHAIEEGKLHICYQPQVSLKDGGIHGVEALCRWEEEDLGSISPIKFIPLAEETGLITRLSEWVLREVCRQLSDWRRRNIPVPAVSINLSAMNFRDADLPDKILRCLGEYALVPKDLMLELTETVLLDSDPASLNTLRKTKDRGLMLSLDDFGTGYSSLGYLRNLPISEMKLDRSFVQDVHENDVSQRLSKAIIRVGESLDLCVLAEGVENKAQFDLLKKQHYHVVQGYYVAKPLPPDELEKWLTNWEPSRVFV